MNSDWLTVILIILASCIGLAVFLFLFGKIFQLTWIITKNLTAGVVGIVVDSVRLLGATLAGLLFAVLVTGSVCIGRWSAAKHFAGAFWAECASGVQSVYRVFVSHPMRMLGLGGALEGIERRVPAAIAAAPGSDGPSGGKRASSLFDGYTVVGSLAGGGSGGKLYVAEPSPEKAAALQRQTEEPLDRVVIKSFVLNDGSSLPQITRESRSLDAAKRLGLVLEHKMTDDRFYYVMRYVPGESLAIVADRLHQQSDPGDTRGKGGLDRRHLREAMSYAADLLSHLDEYHRGGLWHKDVKPDNILITDAGRPGAAAHLVDFGLITPLRSAMTLTTHGTEYFRDPELVRQAIRGVKVHQIDGARFDIYGAGAVLFSVIENSFPAHGGLSRITRNCPDALRWVVRRSMTDYEKRYATAADMLMDLETVLQAEDPFALKPADLPSMRSGSTQTISLEDEADDRDGVAPPPPPPFQPRRAPSVAEVAAAMGTAEPRPLPDDRAARDAYDKPAPGEQPKLEVTNWLTGRYRVIQPALPPMRVATPARPGVAPRPVVHAGSAREQIERARARAAERRLSARQRAQTKRPKSPSALTAGTFIALLFGVVFFTLVGIGIVLFVNAASVQSEPGGPTAPLAAQTMAVTADDLDLRPDDQVLVVSDLAVPTPRQTEAAVGDLLARLAEQGITARGAFTSDPDDATAARLVIARGNQPLDSETLSEDLAEALEDLDLYDAVLWVTAAAPGNEEGVALYTVRESGAWANAVLRTAPAVETPAPAAPAQPSVPPEADDVVSSRLQVRVAI